MSGVAHSVAAQERRRGESRPAAPYDLENLRGEFPILAQAINGRPLVYFDNSATTQKPRAVIDAVTHYYGTMNANVARGVHTLSQRATAAYEATRERVRRFLNARTTDEIVFTRGTTEAINLVAASYGGANFTAGDEIILSAMEHHSNIVPWQLVAARTGARLRVIPMTEAGELRLDEYEKLFHARTKFVAVVHMSNALGTVNPVRAMIATAHAHGVPVLLDGAQSAPHMPIDVQALDCDFFCFSGHKLYGPTGIGVLYGKYERLAAMPPYQGGGEMIDRVTFEKTTYEEPPHRFEAGTPAIAEVVGLGAALDWVARTGLDKMAAWETALYAYAERRALEVPGLKLIGRAREKGAILVFTLDGAHPADIGLVLDRHGVAIRTGHHCAQPVIDFYGVPATARASFAAYNTTHEVDLFVDALHAARQMLVG